MGRPAHPAHAEQPDTAAPGSGRADRAGEPAAAEVEAAQAEERRAEIADLTRRVIDRCGADHAGVVRGDGSATRRRTGCLPCC